MQQAIVSTLPFLGQIVKVTTRDGKEYDVKISEELLDNDKVFSIMFRNSIGTGTSTSNDGGGRNNTNIRPPERPELPVHLRSNANANNNQADQTSQTSQTNQTNQYKKDKKTNINKKIDCTKAGSSISLDDISKQPFKLNF